MDRRRTRGDRRGPQHRRGVLQRTPGRELPRSGPAAGRRSGAAGQHDLRRLLEQRHRGADPRAGVLHRAPAAPVDPRERARGTAGQCQALPGARGALAGGEIVLPRCARPALDQPRGDRLGPADETPPRRSGRLAGHAPGAGAGKHTAQSAADLALLRARRGWHRRAGRDGCARRPCRGDHQLTGGQRRGGRAQRLHALPRPAAAQWRAAVRAQVARQCRWRRPVRQQRGQPAYQGLHDR